VDLKNQKPQPQSSFSADPYPCLVLTQVDLKHQKLAPLKEHALTMRRLVSEAAALKAEITTLERRLPPSSTESRSVSAINSEIEGLEKQRNEVERKREDASQQRTTLDLRVSSLESQHRDAREAKMLADQKAQKLRDIQTTISDLQVNGNESTTYDSCRTDERSNGVHGEPPQRSFGDEGKRMSEV
jgi:chromosome segregation ATPase